MYVAALSKPGTVNHREQARGMQLQQAVEKVSEGGRSERNTSIKPESKDERMGIAAAELTIENHFSTAC
jgi:hypothetical protein